MAQALLKVIFYVSLLFLLLCLLLFGLAQALNAGEIEDHDARFAVLQESWIHDQNRVKQFTAVLTESDCRLLNRLACGHYDCRNAASVDAAQLGPRALRMLAWGQWSRDAEQASRCRKLLTILADCPTCYGSKQCPDCPWFEGWCPTCDKLGYGYKGVCGECVDTRR